MKVENENKNENNKEINPKEDKEIKNDEFNYENLGINKINSYQFREIKGNYFNEHPKRKDYFSNLHFSLNKTDLANIFNQNQ